MGSVALQRVLVRMLYDPPFAARVYENASDALTGLDVTTQEQQWLVDADPRAFRLDPYRRSRSLTGLLDEFPVSAALTVRHAGGVAALDVFFSDPLFHTGLQSGHSLALTFGAYLARTTAIEPIARLEAAIAAVRRPSPSLDRSVWHLAPTVRLLELPTGSVSFHRTVREAHAASAHTWSEFILDDAVAVPLPNLDASEPGHHLVRCDAAGSVDLESLTPELFAILSVAATGCSREELAARGAELGADAETMNGILQDFVASGELFDPH